MLPFFRRAAAWAAAASLVPPATLGAAFANSTPSVTAQPHLGAAVSQYALDPATADPALPNSEMVKLIRQKVKYVFVLFNENESFDHLFGAFPGVDGLYSNGAGARAPANTPGFTQTYKDVDGAVHTVRPFRIGPQQNASFMDSVDHSHAGLARKLDVVYGAARMDGFARDEYSKYASSPAASKAQQAQGARFAELVMSHVDCDTVPLFWRYANRFTIFDNIFATEDTPSTPNAIAMIAGQSGETQWVKHGAKPEQNQPISGAINGTTYTGAATPQGVPVVNDPQPWFGSAFDAAKGEREPTGPKEFWGPTNTSVNLTFATVPLTLAGGEVNALMAGDRAPGADLADIQGDIPYIAANGSSAVSWRWYQNGYGDDEPNEPTFAPSAPHANYVSHHNGPQYFGYLADNRDEQKNMRGENDFFHDMETNQLPPGGGVFYIRGGFYNLANLRPPIQNPKFPNPAGLTPSEIAAIDAAKSGDDDHPAYSDHMISEAMNARVINAIALHPEIWSQSAIVITYDESDGFYDHVPPRILSYGPDGLPLARGVRIPLLLISPFARAGAVSHAEGDHNAVIETINAIFGLPALSSLPEERAALAAGDAAAFNKFAEAHGPANFAQKWLGPRDANTTITDSLLSGFSPMRLKGLAAPLPPDYASIPDDIVQSLPHYGGKGCEAIGVTPTDAGTTDPIPAGFNTLPALLPAYN